LISYYYILGIITVKELFQGVATPWAWISRGVMKKKNGIRDLEDKEGRNTFFRFQAGGVGDPGDHATEMKIA
jgi:hypothetical protein